MFARAFQRLVLLNILFTVTQIIACNEAGSQHRRPNVIIFLADDMGYGDLKSFGHPTQEATFVDWMVNNGLKLTNLYSAAVLCTPSRSALLTGRQPVRSGIVGEENVFIPCLNTGLPRNEVTIAEVLKDAGYSTGMVGKWHLGLNKNNRTDGYHLPRNHGFDFVGTILPFTLQDYCDTKKVHREHPRLSLCFLYHDTTLIEQPIQLEMLTGRLLHDVQAFLNNQTKDKPFFLFVSFPQTHTPMFNIPRFQNVSKRGAYGDQILEMSWAMEEIYSTLQKLQLHENTLSIFLSDQGPHLEICDLGGTSEPFRGGKASYREGGLRVPTVLHWPSVLTRPRVSHTVVSTMDFLPTIAELAGTKVPQDRVLDGLSFTDIIFETQGSPLSQRKLVYFMCSNLLIAVRYKEYKIYYRKLPDLSDEKLNELCKDGFGRNYFEAGEDCRQAEVLGANEVYNIENDPKETKPLPPDIAEIIVNEIANDVQIYMSTFEEPQELLSNEYCVSSLVPCCNPPFCYCMDNNNLNLPKSLR